MTFMNVKSLYLTAPCLTSKKVKQWILEHDIHDLECPGNSSDLTPIENCWPYMKKLGNSHSLLMPVLREARKMMWGTDIDTKYLRYLVDSILKCLKMLIHNKGWIIMH